MAQINREREDKFFEILGQLKSEFYRDLDAKSDKGYFLNDSFLKAIEQLITIRHRLWLPTDYPILRKCNLRYDDIAEAIDNLYRGIEDNIDLLSGQQQERYIHSLLVPFAELCDEGIKRGIEYSSNHFPFPFSGDESFFRARYISDKINCVGPILGGNVFGCQMSNDSPEYIIEEREFQKVAIGLRSMSYNALLFYLICDIVGARLDALLLERGINLLWYQNQCGVQLVKERNLPRIARYLGTPELVVKYIDEALPKIDETSEERLEQKQEIATDIFSDMPKALQTDEAREIFKRAEDSGLLSISGNCVKWNGEKQLLAYFAARMSERFCLTNKLDKDGNKTTAWKPFEILFDMKDLKGAKQNWMRLNTKFEPTGFEKVDALF